MGYSAGPQIGLADLIFSNSVSHLFCLIPTTSFFAFDRTAEKRSGATPHLPKLAAVLGERSRVQEAGLES